MNDRRSPADRTNGNTGSRCGGASVDSPSSSPSSSSMARWTSPSSVRTRDQTTSGSSTVNTKPGGRVEDGVEQRLAGRRSGAEPSPLDRVRERLGAAVRRRPQDGRSRRVVGQRRTERPVEHDRRQPAELRLGGDGGEERLGEPSPGSRRPPPAAGAGRPRSPLRGLRTAERGSPVRPACPGAARGAAGGGGRRSHGKSKLKNVASHFSNCDAAGST